MSMANETDGKRATVELDSRQREILRLLWRSGRLSRWELHRQMGVNPNAVGVDVAALLSERIVRECQSEVAGPGRPGHVEAGRLSLRGQLLGRPLIKEPTDPSKIISVAQSLLKEALNDQTL